MTADAQPAAQVRVVRGDPDEVEVAALVAGLLASQQAAEAAGTSPGGWSDHGRGLRGVGLHRHGPDVWRWSRRG